MTARTPRPKTYGDKITVEELDAFVNGEMSQEQVRKMEKACERDPQVAADVARLRELARKTSQTGS